MQWIATNIRFPEDMYMQLKMEAARQRVSVAQVVRERLKKTRKKSKKSCESLLAEFDKVAKANAKFLKGKSLAKLLIEMRYEQ